MNWMYKGLSGHVDREEYLTGRKIDKTFELIEKEENPNKVKDDEENSVINRLAHKTFLDTLASASAMHNDQQAKAHEDPLEAIKLVKQEQARKLLQNPLKLKQYEKLIMKSLEKDKSKKKKKKHKHKSSKTHEKDREHRKHLKDDRQSDGEDERIKSSKDKVDVPSSSTSKSHHDHHHRGSHNHSSKHETRVRENNRKADHHKERKRDHHSQESKKKLSQEEIEKKRMEMASNASWRESSRSQTVEKLNTLDQDEEDKHRSHKRGASFIKPMLNHISSSASLEESIKKKRSTSQRSADDRPQSNYFARH